jgi:hypothetical protein
MKTKIISFYADIENRNYYSLCGQKLKESLEKFNVEHEIEEISSSNDYMLNCLKKPGFILKKILDCKKPLIWVDVDTDFRSPFEDFDKNDCDIGFCSDTGDVEGVKASPIYFNYNENALLFLNKWKEECEKAVIEKKTELDHDVIKYILLPEFNNKIKIKILSENFIDFYNGKHIKSRLSKNFVTKNLAHKKIKEINRYRKGLSKKEYKSL